MLASLPWRLEQANDSTLLKTRVWLLQVQRTANKQKHQLRFQGGTVFSI